jgi:hypothetical protein
MLIEEELIDRNTVPRFNTASHPWYANIMILPDFVKERLIVKYQEAQEKYLFNPELANGFKVITQTLKNGTASWSGMDSNENKGGILEFKAFNENLDNFRGETLTDIVPELLEVYAWAAEK